MYRIIIEKHWSGLFHISWFGSGQKICVSPRYFKKVTGAPTDLSIGSLDIGVIELHELGFIV